MEVEKHQKLLGLVASLLGILGGIAEVTKEAQAWKPGTGAWIELALGIVVIVVGLTFLVRTARSLYARVSRLVAPDAMRLDPRLPEHLIGRTEDIRKLLRALSSPLTFLVSESGCGKSALLQAGIQHDKIFNERFLPIYIDMSVLDWETDPMRALRDGLARSVSSDERAVGGPDSGSTDSVFVEELSSFYKKHSRRPLLLLDQVDDYQSQPLLRTRFLPDSTRVWISSDVVVKTNAFWRIVAQGLERDVLTVIIACRIDAASGLESFRFPVRISQFQLERLDKEVLSSIINQLTSPHEGQPIVVEEPEHGWTDLKARLLRDLRALGPDVLPQQLKAILGGLRSLDGLTPKAYSRAGRVEGLEASFVIGAIQRAERRSSLKSGAVLKILLPMIVRKSDPPSKAVPQSTETLSEQAGLSPKETLIALESLVTDKIVRQLDGSDDGSFTWQLDHAYLARPILRIEREHDKWKLLLVQRADLYLEAPLTQKWALLLPIGIQLSLFWARLRGRVQYGPQRSYALKSIARWLPTAAVGALCACVGWAALEYEAGLRIEQQYEGMASQEPSETLTDDAAAALADLKRRGWIARRQVTQDIFASPALADSFTKAPLPILRALVGLDPTKMGSIVDGYGTLQALTQSDKRLRSAANTLILVSAKMLLPAEVKARLERVLIAALLSKSPNVDISAIEQGLTYLFLSRWADDAPVAIELSELRGAMTTRATSDFVGLFNAYAAVVSTLKIGDDRVAREIEAISRTFSKGSDAERDDDDSLSTQALKLAYAILATKLKDGDPHMADALDKLESAMSDGFDIEAGPVVISNALISLDERTNNSKDHIALELSYLLSAVAHDDDSDEVATLSNSFISVTHRLVDGDESLSSGLAATRKAITAGDIEEDQFSALKLFYFALIAKVPVGDPLILREMKELRNSLPGADDYEISFMLLDCYTAAAEKLKPGSEVARAEADAVTESLDTEDDFDRIAVLTLELSAVAAKVKEGDVHSNHMLGIIRTVLGMPIRYEWFERLSRSYALEVSKLPRNDDLVIDEMSEVRKEFSNLYRIDTPKLLAVAYTSLVSKLSNGNPRIAVELEAIREKLKESDGRLAHALAECYVALADKLPVGDATVSREVIALRGIVEGTGLSPGRLTAVALASSALPGVSKEIDALLSQEILSMRASFGEADCCFDMFESLVPSYRAVFKKLDKRNGQLATEEEGSLRAKLSANNNSSTLTIFAQLFTALVDENTSAIEPQADVSVLLLDIPRLRSSEQCAIFSDAISSVIWSRPTPSSLTAAGFAIGSLLHEPVCAGRASSRIVDGFEKILILKTDRPANNSWQGDVWGFVDWAEANLHDFEARSSTQPRT